MGGRFQTPAGRTALGGVLAAGSLAVLWLACLSPTGQVGLTAVAGLFPVAAVLAAGRWAAVLCWAAASVLGLLVLPGKGVALLFLVFFGIYPVVKSRLEIQKNRGLEWLGKLAHFNLSFTIIWLGAGSLLLETFPAWLTKSLPLLYGAGNVVFVAYDIALSRLIGVMAARLRRR